MLRGARLQRDVESFRRRGSCGSGLHDWPRWRSRRSGRCNGRRCCGRRSFDCRSGLPCMLASGGCCCGAGGGCGLRSLAYLVSSERALASSSPPSILCSFIRLRQASITVGGFAPMAHRVRHKRDDRIAALAHHVGDRGGLQVHMVAGHTGRKLTGIVIDDRLEVGRQRA